MHSGPQDVGAVVEMAVVWVGCGDRASHHAHLRIT